MHIHDLCESHLKTTENHDHYVILHNYIHLFIILSQMYQGKHEFWHKYQYGRQSLRNSTVRFEILASSNFLSFPNIFLKIFFKTCN